MARDFFCSLLSQLTSLLLQRAAKSFIVGVVNSMKPYHDPWRQGCRLFRTRRSLSNPSFSVSNFIFVFCFLRFLFFIFLLPTIFSKSQKCIISLSCFYTMACPACVVLPSLTLILSASNPFAEPVPGGICHQRQRLYRGTTTICWPYRLFDGR